MKTVRTVFRTDPLLQHNRSSEKFNFLSFYKIWRRDRHLLKRRVTCMNLRYDIRIAFVVYIFTRCSTETGEILIFSVFHDGDGFHVLLDTA